MSYLITLSTLDDQYIRFDCNSDQSVQDAAEAAGYYPPAICKMGGCGSCVATCDSGDYELKSFSAGILPENVEETGETLLCRTYPKSDLVIHVPYNAERIESRKPVAREAEIVKVEKIAERTMSLVLQLAADEEKGLAFEFEPGQFVELEVPELNLKRAYSIANTPNWEGRLEFLIRLQANGQFSNYLQTQAEAGQLLKVHGPAGTFTVQEQSLSPRCFIAGGTGLAPFLSMLRRMAEWGEHHPVQLFLGVNNEQEIFYQQELEDLQQRLPQLHVNICVWQSSEEWIDFRGTPADALAFYLKQVDVLPDIYLCGPPPLVEAATKTALQNGISPEKIHCERFA